MSREHKFNPSRHKGLPEKDVVFGQLYLVLTEPGEHNIMNKHAKTAAISWIIDTSR